MLQRLIHVVLHRYVVDDSFIVSNLGTTCSLPGSFHLVLCIETNQFISIHPGIQGAALAEWAEEEAYLEIDPQI